MRGYTGRVTAPPSALGDVLARRALLLPPDPAPEIHDGGYRAPLWLPGGHLQTLWPALWARPAPVTYRRERWETPDGDFIDLDHALPPHDTRPIASASISPAATAPLVALFHGLEGSSESHTSRSLMAAVVARGWRGVVVHWRGCSGEANRLPRAYHSGDSAEIDWIQRRLKADFAIGISLGGNVLAKWLGEQGEAAALTAAVIIAAPQDLRAGAERLSRGPSHAYCRHFLWTLRRKSLDMLDRHPGLLDRERVRRARDFFEFDDAVTAPLHGFASAFDYWQRSSCRQFLGGIRIPTLMVNALNDPFLPISALATASEVSTSVTLDYPREGGHAGFPSGHAPRPDDWLARRTLDFLSDPERVSSAGHAHG